MQISDLRLKCIYCRREFNMQDSELSGEKYKCMHCRRIYHINNNIPILARKTRYYGELPRKDMIRLIEDLDSSDWKKAVFQRCAMISPFLYQIIMDETRADFQFLFSLNENSLALDIGSGWGTISVPLAQRARVVAIDNTQERLYFLKKRCSQDRIGNIVLICADNLELPFSDSQFDLAILNGVLEWVGLLSTRRDPYMLQLQALRQVHSILKPKGKLYIGIENSHSIRYLLGVPDDHVNIPYISYLSRPKANQLMLKKKGKLYRTYTYDKDGYIQLLKNSGFNKIEFYYPAPIYKMFSYMIPLDNLQAVRFYYDYLQPDFAKDTLEQKIRESEMQALQDGTFEEKISSYAIIASKSDD